LTEAEPPIALHDAVAVAAPRPVLLIAAGDVADEARPPGRQGGHSNRRVRRGRATLYKHFPRKDDPVLA